MSYSFLDYVIQNISYLPTYTTIWHNIGAGTTKNLYNFMQLKNVVDIDG